MSQQETPNELFELKAELSLIKELLKEAIAQNKVLSESLADYKNQAVKGEKLARNNRALGLLTIVVAPLVLGYAFYDVNSEFDQTGLKSGSIKSREVPPQATTLATILGVGGTLGLSKDEILGLIKKK